jgi:hypothetical protein
MSDVTCATCREPWDTYHLRHDAIHEVVPYEAPEGTARKWDGKLDSVVWNNTARVLLADDGWQFGGSINDVRHCPCCPKGVKSKPNPLRDELVGMLEGDDDGIAAMLEDFDGL